MLANLLGPELFRKGTDLYFERHDGQAVTTEDFVGALEDASGRDLTQFKRWYSQAGTPRLTVTDHYDPQTGDYTLRIAQSCPPTPECEHKKPFHIPLAMGLLGEGGALPLRLKGQAPNPDTEDNTHKVLELTEAEQSFVFEGLPEKPVPSLLRNFSAPVKLQYDYSRDDLMLLMSRDTDGFSRWDASQQLASEVIEDVMQIYRRGESLNDVTIDPRLVEAYRGLLQDESLDKAMVALMLSLPSEGYLSEQADEIDVEAIHYSREAVRLALAQALAPELRRIYQSYDHSQPYEPSAGAIAERSLKNKVLSYLMLLAEEEILAACERQYRQANNMTDALAALTELVNSSEAGADTRRRESLADFYQRWQDEPLVVDQWFRVQATSSRPGTLELVRELEQHPAFEPNNPNKIRALVAAFASANPVHFHQSSGAGYDFLMEHIQRLNRSNPQIAARLLTPFTRWRKYPEPRREQMRSRLEQLKAQPDLSKDVYEVVSKTLA